MSGWDAWYWGDESVVTRKEKSQNFIKQFGSSDNTVLRYYRYLHCLWYLANEVAHYFDHDGFPIFSLEIAVKKTEWGW